VSAETKAFFVVSSGRSGTAMLHKALSLADDIEMHHEYMVHIVQPLAVRRTMGLADAAEARHVLTRTHAAAVRYSEAAHWGDSSNKLSWLIPELAELMPEAKFVHLVRDGRKVTSSYFHKLGAECYDDRSTSVLQAYFDDPAELPAPPPEKKFWWPLPRHDDARSMEFRRYDQLARIAWHWAEINTRILESLDALPKHRQFFVRLEDLVTSPRLVNGLLDFLNLSHRPEHFEIFARPHNVNRPEDRPLTEQQLETFSSIASPMMERLGYAERDAYVVNY